MRSRPDELTPVSVVRTGIRCGQILAIGTACGLRLLPVAAGGLLPGRRGSVAAESGRILSRYLWRLGPAFVKAGQLLSTRQDVLPPQLCRELQAALAFGREAVRDPATGELRIADVGSVATVRRARVRGTEVAVKSIRPGTVERLELDLGVLRLLTAGLMRLMPRSRLPLPQIVHEITESVRRQTDLAGEADTLRRLATLERTLPVLLPTVLPDRSNDRQLTMTWLPGQAGGRDFSSDKRVAKRLVLAVYEMLFITGVVHCDLHPGNWWELPDGRLAIVDAGFAYQLDDEMRSHFAEFFLGMASNNAELCATHALAACAVPVSAADEAGFRADMEHLISTTTGKTAGDFSLAAFAARFFAIQRRHHAYSRATFIFPFMALLAIEGQVKQLDPGINFQALAGPVVLRAIVNRARTGSSDSVA